MRRVASITGLALLAVLFASGCSTVRDTRRTFDTVVIDPGHGGHDPGAISPRGTREKDVNLDVARRLDRKLRAAGFRTVMTRNDDRFIPLSDRARISNARRNAVFVSIHFNSSRNRGARGLETFYYHRYGYDIASKVQDSIRTVANTPNRGVKNARFHVLRNNLNPAILVEGAFLSNYYDDRLARSVAYRERLAELIARALVEQRHGSHGLRGGARFAGIRSQ